ncbi:hypothetical protein BUZ00_00755 [Staphylococcus gallinarum]|nr:hypothetical protein BUZ00_00755 [Staphylococcus gallinarum]PTK92664.1 hypothetical protein BUZ03_01800 [Staphylococcus gallinarum]RIL22750.1 hypothetical protein BUY99_06215 [Staphylococcus gallinarum]RIL26017.1 hypothetical protein BUY97_01975 [Staphylococcus gallinarum]RIL28228.1 hypothetical protein BUY95_08420 [Staphylococcus gallinarum]
MNYNYLNAIFICYFALLARFPRGQLQPVVFSSTCSLRSLAKMLPKNDEYTLTSSKINMSCLCLQMHMSLITGYFYLLFRIIGSLS